jgi:hypothetical protein
LQTFSIEAARPIKGYSKPDEAIAAGPRHPKNIKAQLDAIRLQGQTLVGVRWSASRWALEFTGALWLDIHCHDEQVEWDIVLQLPQFDEMNEPMNPRWPSGNEYIIDPATLIAPRIGAAFRGFFAADWGLNVYLQGRLYLSFHAMRRIDDGSSMLFIAEEQQHRPPG